MSPSVADRIEAMKRCAGVGYPLRAVIMPIIPIEEWGRVYSTFLIDLLEAVLLERITLGQICIYATN